ncbi:hypothetical protein DL765_002793 [Monosporascus sp. GIB2]|nr:hypothetical protein DL765_002793 [Monosporascus sp. GIB2]
MKPELSYGHVPADFPERLNKAEKHPRAILQTWDVSSATHVGFEIIVPAMIELLEKDGTKLSLPGRQALTSFYQQKLSKFRRELLYTERKTTLMHSLEAFVDKIDFDRVAHHIDEQGSIMASPAVTVPYLMHCST